MLRLDILSKSQAGKYEQDKLDLMVRYKKGGGDLSKLGATLTIIQRVNREIAYLTTSDSNGTKALKKRKATANATNSGTKSKRGKTGVDAREGDKEEEKKEEDMDTQDEGESLVNDLKFYGFDLNEMEKVLTSEQLGTDKHYSLLNKKTELFQGFSDKLLTQYNILINNINTSIVNEKVNEPKMMELMGCNFKQDELNELKKELEKYEQTRKSYEEEYDEVRGNINTFFSTNNITVDKNTWDFITAMGSMNEHQLKQEYIKCFIIKVYSQYHIQTSEKGNSNVKNANALLKYITKFQTLLPSTPSSSSLPLSPHPNNTATIDITQTPEYIEYFQWKKEKEKLDKEQEEKDRKILELEQKLQALENKG